MNAKRTRAVVVAALLLTMAGGARTVLAHHSQSQFDSDKTVTIEGTLTKASWSNPHTLFVMDGKRAGESGATQEWTVEGPAPRQLEAKGWTRAVSKAGDKLTFEGRPRRDGQAELLLLSVTLADGKTFSFKPD